MVVVEQPIEVTYAYDADGVRRTAAFASRPYLAQAGVQQKGVGTALSRRSVVVLCAVGGLTILALVLADYFNAMWAFQAFLAGLTLGFFAAMTESKYRQSKVERAISEDLFSGEETRQCTARLTRAEASYSEDGLTLIYPFDDLLLHEMEGDDLFLRFKRGVIRLPLTQIYDAPGGPAFLASLERD